MYYSPSRLPINSTVGQRECRKSKRIVSPLSARNRVCGKAGSVYLKCNSCLPSVEVFGRHLMKGVLRLTVKLLLFCKRGIKCKITTLDECFRNKRFVTYLSRTSNARVCSQKLPSQSERQNLKALPICCLASQGPGKKSTWEKPWPC